MTTDSDLFRLHPVTIIGSLAAGREEPSPRADAEPDLDPERVRAHRRLLALLTGRFQTPEPARPGASAPADPRHIDSRA
jgi:hypothetical protein